MRQLQNKKEYSKITEIDLQPNPFGLEFYNTIPEIQPTIILPFIDKLKSIKNLKNIN